MDKMLLGSRLKIAFTFAFALTLVYQRVSLTEGLLTLVSIL